MNRYTRNPNQTLSLSRGEPCVSPKKKKFDFIKRKDCACQSLYEVEYFLSHLRQFAKYIKLYCLLK